MKSPSENKIRIIASIIVLLSLLFVYTQNIFIPIFISVDFFFRAFNLGKYSVLSAVTSFIIKIFKIKEKPVYFPPKQFAAKIGLLFSLSLVVLNYLGINSLIIASVLIFCASLEAFFNFCVGCYVYSLIQKFVNQK